MTSPTPKETPTQPEDAHLEAAYEDAQGGSHDYDEAAELDSEPYWFGSWEDF